MLPIQDVIVEALLNEFNNHNANLKNKLEGRYFSVCMLNKKK